MGILSVVFYALTLVALPTAAKRPMLHGTVTDAGGAAIKGAYILAFDDQVQVKSHTPFPGKTVIASETGTFALTLQAGFYDVCVFSSGFAPVCKKVQFSKYKGDVLYNVELKVDPLIIQERGDQFPIR